MVESLEQIAEELYEWRIANGFDEVRVFSMDDSDFDYAAYATKGQLQLDLRRAHHDRDDG